MSYSRWGGSHWYTFWANTSSEKRDEQVFDIDCQMQFTYKQLRDDLEGCLEKVKESFCEATDDELNELCGYMRQFIKDVETDADLSAI